MSKYSLLIGINYKDSESELNGCINDINNVKEMLTSNYDYDEKNITILTDDTEKKPNYDIIIQEIINLSKISYQPEVTEIWISYSGHGAYIKDTNGDEDDGKDECLVPLDYQTKGLICDDLLNQVLGLINPKVKVIIVVDACHSETIFDLPYRYISGEKNVIENKNSKVKCDCIMISGCRDDQTSADAYNIKNSKEYSGAMTTALLHVLKQNKYNISCWKLLKQMRMFLKNRNFTQVPQICCTKELDKTIMFSCKNFYSFLS